MILERLRQARDPGRDSEGTEAGPEPGSGAAGLPAQSRPWLRWPRRPVGSQPRAGAAVRVRRAAPRRAPPRGVSSRPARPAQSRRPGKMVEDGAEELEDLVHFSVSELPSRGYGVMEEIRRQGKLCDVTLKVPRAGRHRGVS